MADKTEKKVLKAAADEKAVVKKDKKDKKPGLFKRIGKWFREMGAEMKKITWPTIPQTLKNTLIVIVMVLVVGAIIWIMDAVLGLGINALRNLVA